MKKIYLLFVLSSMFAGCDLQKNKPESQSSPWLTTVFEYVYAPGQHAVYAEPADTAAITGDPSKEADWLYLGGFGGYVVAGFDHDVQNLTSFDLAIFPLKGSAPEPAIVYVMQDTNKDGLPNDSWYELKGNQFDNSKRNYWLRYYKAQNETANVTWKDADGKTGELKPGYGANYSSAWWWQSTSTDSITFYGSRLPDAYVDTDTTAAQSWNVPVGLFTFGYAENITGEDYDATWSCNKLDISNAVDAAGNAVNLSSVRFIKIQSAVFQIAGWTNEVSSEIKGAADLHLLK